MSEANAQKYQWGQTIAALVDLYNDGSYPDSASDAMLVASGSQGEVVQVGTHVDSGMPVYLVEFASGHVVGCLEQEIGAV